MTWQPIETAPKDGTRILLGRFVPMCGQGKDGHIDVDWWRSKKRDGYDGWGNFNMQWWPPTHWHKLPEYPK